ncbi:MAG: hypothetical protein HOO91_01950 [Bacteroidales bacterium]|nr:hypothetical protein [Bacteroidales bacterium]
MKTRIVKWLGVLLIGMTGCYDYSNFQNIAIDPFSPSFVFPVVKSKITFKELAEKSGANTLVEQHPGSNMYFLAFRDTIDIGLATSLFNIPPITFNDTYGLSAGEIPPIFPAGTVLGPLTKTYDQTYTTFAGAELKRVDLSGGTLQVSLTNTFNHSISGDITITSLKNVSNSSTVLNFTLPNNGSTYNNSINLNGYYLDLLDAPSTYNNVKYSVTATITSSGNPSLAGNIAIQLSINSPTYQKITGKINYSFIHTNQPYSISIFNSTILAQQHLAEPKLSLDFINSFGIPSNVNFTRFDVENNLGTIISVTNSATTQPGDLLIGTPNMLKYATISKPVDTTKLKLDHTNSNIEDVFDIAPRTIGFGATFGIGDATTNHDYFIRNDSKFQLLSEIEIPLLGWVVTNQIADTIANINWPDLQNSDILLDDSTKVTLKFKFSNELPLDMYLQAYFLNQVGLAVDSLYNTGSNWFIKSAPVAAATGESSGSTNAYSYVKMNKVKYDKISTSKNMILLFRFKTGGADNIPPQNITILSTNSIAVDMSVEVSGTVKPKL